MKSNLEAALAFHRDGITERAGAIYSEILQADPQNAEVLHLLGVAALQCSNHLGTIEFISAAIALDAGRPDFFFNLGVCLEELELTSEAIDCYTTASQLDSCYADSLLNLGNCLHRSGDAAGAIGAYQQAIGANEECAAAHSNLGNVLQEVGRLDDALANHLCAVKIEPDHAPYHYNLGNVLKNLGRFDAAIESYRCALRLRPNYGAVLGNLGGIYLLLGRCDESLICFQQALDQNLSDSEAYSNLGNAYVALRRFVEAIVCFERAIEINPTAPAAYMNCGNALIGLNRFEDAIGFLLRAVQIDPSYAEAFVNLGSALKHVGRFSDALIHYERAIQLEPLLPEAHWNKGLLQLLLGDFLNGWRSYEWRPKTRDSLRARRNFAQPLWLGEESLSGKSILVHSEQGLGDTIQFCRYIPLVAARGATVIFEIPLVLFPLLRGLEGVGKFVVNGDSLPPIDFHCPLLSLPAAFGTTLASITLPVSDIEADAGKLAIWSGRLGGKIKPRVGLVWSGNLQHTNDHNRSIPLSTLLRSLPVGFEYVSLQREVRGSDQGALDLSPEIRHFGLELEDFTDTAALCALMDLVVSVDTSVAHLSGTMGRQTWILLPYLPDWRWLLGRPDSPWYPSAKLFRQTCARDWESVLNQLGDELTRIHTGLCGI